MNTELKESMLREAKTVINCVPLNDTIIFKGVYIGSHIDMVGNSPKPKLQYMEVVAYGCNTHTLEIGDVILVHDDNGATMRRPIFVPDNKFSINAAKNLAVTNSAISKGNPKSNPTKYYIEEYFAMSYMDITAVLDDDASAKVKQYVKDKISDVPKSSIILGIGRTTN